MGTAFFKLKTVMLMLDQMFVTHAKLASPDLFECAHFITEWAIPCLSDQFLTVPQNGNDVDHPKKKIRISLHSKSAVSISAESDRLNNHYDYDYDYHQKNCHKN
jgi:hypothetical protein